MLIPSPSISYAHLLSRKLLLHPIPVSATAPAPKPDPTPSSSFDANVVMILAVLLCALICALGLNSIVRCMLRCSSTSRLQPEPAQSACLVSARVRRKALRSLPVFLYSANLKLPGTGSDCAICLSEFVPGERIRVLPKCSHGFHVKCIDRWLMARPSCPTCRQCMFVTPLKKSVLSIVVPLEPEGLIHAYREGDV